MTKSLPLMIRHAMYSLRGGFLIRPLTIALTLGGAGAFLLGLRRRRWYLCCNCSSQALSVAS